MQPLMALTIFPSGKFSSKRKIKPLRCQDNFDCLIMPQLPSLFAAVLNDTTMPPFAAAHDQELSGSQETPNSKKVASLVCWFFAVRRKREI